MDDDLAFLLLRSHDYECARQISQDEILLAYLAGAVTNGECHCSASREDADQLPQASFAAGPTGG